MSLKLFSKKQDTGQFERLAAESERQVYAVCFHMMGNREDAQDCAQEAMLRAFRAFDTFRRDASFSTWITRIAMNVCTRPAGGTRAPAPASRGACPAARRYAGNDRSSGRAGQKLRGNRRNIGSAPGHGEKPGEPGAGKIIGDPQKIFGTFFFPIRLRK